LAGGLIGYDVVTGGLPKNAQPLAGDFSQVRWSLLPDEIERYRQAGRAASEAMERTISQIKPGLTETQIAGLAANNIWVAIGSTVGHPDRRRRTDKKNIATPFPRIPTEKIVEVVFAWKNSDSFAR